MSSPPIIRLATIEDIESLCALEIEFDRYYELNNLEAQYERVSTDKIPKHFYKKSFQESIKDANARIFIAEVDGNIVGSSTVVKELKTPEELYSIGYVGHIESIFVLEEYRGQGIGKALIDAMFNWLRSEGVIMCTLSVLEKNNEALKLYETLGFEKERVKMYRKI